MPPDVQKSFLRVLESRHFRPVGGKQEKASNFRVISSTNRDLDEMVDCGAFRKDLLHRLRAFHLILPPLRERREDMADLAKYHLNRLADLYGLPAKEISPDFFNTLQVYEWPGNVRELVNIMEFSLSASQHEKILYDYHLPVYLRARVARTRLSRPGPETESAAPVVTEIEGAFPRLQVFREQAVERAEADYIKALMSAANRNVNKACALSGLSRSRLYELLKKYTKN
jgi:two-component system NtrC family response regulator